jgi:hypothetical protein
MHRLHAALGLLGRGRAAEDRPDLGVEVDLAFGIVLRAIDVPSSVMAQMNQSPSQPTLWM